MWRWQNAEDGIELRLSRCIKVREGERSFEELGVDGGTGGEVVGGVGNGFGGFVFGFGWVRFFGVFVDGNGLSGFVLEFQVYGGREVRIGGTQGAEGLDVAEEAGVSGGKLLFVAADQA